ncbi:MAG: prtrc system protein e [Flavisolibacter sp.]|nr:prtrc system protein e [Flavisolibacter sp.]
METNFFTLLADLQLQGDLIISVRTLPDEVQTISVYLKNEQCNDPARHRITPFTATVKAAELNRDFFPTLTEPLQATSSLMLNMEAYNRQLKEAKAASAMEKENKSKKGQEEDAKTKRFNESMKKVEELDAEGKHRQALAALPDPAEYPEQADALEEKRKALTEKFAPELF